MRGILVTFRITCTIALAVLYVVAPTASVQAEVLTGAIAHQPESVGVFTWGDGVNDLFQQWSVNQVDYAGWFYGTNYQYTSNADVYVYPGLIDPQFITDASVFPYESGSVWGAEGSTVFFRGNNGYYGAWVVVDIYPPDDPDDPTYAYLDGIWYFLTDQSADFSQGTVATESRTLSGVKALFD